MAWVGGPLNVFGLLSAKQAGWQQSPCTWPAAAQKYKQLAHAGKVVLFLLGRLSGLTQKKSGATWGSTWTRNETMNSTYATCYSTWFLAIYFRSNVQIYKSTNCSSVLADVKAVDPGRLNPWSLLRVAYLRIICFVSGHFTSLCKTYPAQDSKKQHVFFFTETTEHLMFITIQPT